MHGDSKVAGTEARTHSFLLLATSVSLHFEVLFFYCKPVLSTQWKIQCRECHSLPALPPNSRKEMKEDAKGKVFQISNSSISGNGSDWPSLGQVISPGPI